MRSCRFPLLLALCALVLAVVPCRAADEENPFKKAAVGDWASYKVTTEIGGQKIEASIKNTVTAKDEKEATIKTVPTFNGQEQPAQEAKIDLTKPFDPTNIANLPKEAEAKVKKIEDGKETLTVGKNKYDCKWQLVKVTAKMPGQDKEVESEFKVWTCPTAPLGGMVKMEVKSEVIKMSMILDDSGKGK